MKFFFKLLVKSFSLCFLALLMVVTVFADSNGVWHKAEDIRFGTFGSDENGSGLWVFQGPVNFQIDSYFDNKVGIGTSSPRSNLEINGRVFVSNHGLSPSSGKGAFFSFNPSLSGGVGVLQAYDYDLGVSKNIIIQTSGGNVGIGTSDPIYKLDVNGDLIANNLYGRNMIYINGQSLDARYVNSDGDTINGNLNVTGVLTGNEMRAVDNLCLDGECFEDWSQVCSNWVADNAIN
jgi:hypothetical protein